MRFSNRLANFKGGQHRSKLFVIGFFTCALSACGGGSDDPAASGTQISAKSTAVPASKVQGQGQAEDGMRGKRAMPYDPRFASANPAMRKLARKRCERDLVAAVADDKGGHATLPTKKMRREHCGTENEVPG